MKKKPSKRKGKKAFRLPAIRNVWAIWSDHIESIHVQSAEPTYKTFGHERCVLIRVRDYQRLLRAARGKGR